jgi:putative glutamine amidotransferase
LRRATWGLWYDGRMAERRPLIGITTYLVPAAFGPWRLDCALIPTDYVNGVERGGGRALLVPPTGVGVEETLDALDGIVFSGGADIDPARYGQDGHRETTGIERFRDDYEFALLERALERDLPVLGICRGSQVLNVGLGGDLVQHLPEVSDETHKDAPGDFADHEVDVEPGTRVGGLLGSRAPVKSHHHQGFGRLGSGLVVAARADDGTVEAVEDPERRFAVGVLWHPEAGEDMALFAALVEEARAFRDARAGAGAGAT